MAAKEQRSNPCATDNTANTHQAARIKTATMGASVSDLKTTRVCHTLLIYFCPCICGAKISVTFSSTFMISGSFWYLVMFIGFWLISKIACCTLGLEKPEARSGVAKTCDRQQT